MVNPNMEYLNSYYLILEEFESSTAEYHQYNVQNYCRKEEKFNCLSGSSDINTCVISIQVIFNPISLRKSQPDKYKWTSDQIPWTDTFCQRLSRKYQNHSSNLPDRPNMSFNLKEGILWSTVSNTVERFRRTSHTDLTWSINIIVSIFTVSMPSSHE